MITYVIPTRNRPHILEETLLALAALGPHDAEVLVIDNASQTPPTSRVLASGVPVRVICLHENRSASARNVAITAAHAASTWLVMLDDDSCPMDLGFLGVLDRCERDVGAIAAEVFLPDAGGEARHESGGLPEVFIGCGAAIRTHLFRELGGYDASFDYYAEEYDFCARLLHAGHRVAVDRCFRVMHRKETAGRNFDRIIANLVRNNAWVAMRYAPSDEARREEVARHLRRYAAIAWKEHALAGYVCGLAALARSASTQPDRHLSAKAWDRFTGMAAACDAIRHAHSIAPLGRTALVHHGKNSHVVAEAAARCGVCLVENLHDAETLLIATLSPGPMIDAATRLATHGGGHRVVLPWSMTWRNRTQQPSPRLRAMLAA
jgi:GT2 family glycosyltransferase